MKFFFGAFHLILLGCCLGTFAQSKKEVKKFSIKSCTVTITSLDSAGKEKSFTDSYNAFDKNGKVVEEKEFDHNGNFRKHESHKYNKNSDETEWTEFDERGNMVRRTVTEYNSNNDKKTESVYDGKGLLTEKTQFSYNPDGEKISELITDVSGKTMTRSIFVYDKNGLKVARKTYNAARQLIMMKRYAYEFQ